MCGVPPTPDRPAGELLPTGLTTPDPVSLQAALRDFADRGPHPWALDGHLPATQDHFAASRAGSARWPIGLVRVPRAAESDPILFQHRGEHAHARSQGQFQQLRPRVDEQIDERQMTQR